VILSGQLGMLALLDKKIAARYKSPQRDLYREGFKDKEGLWTAMFTNLMVTSYNTRFVKKEEAPRRVAASAFAPLTSRFASFFLCCLEQARFPLRRRDGIEPGELGLCLAKNSRRV